MTSQNEDSISSSPFGDYIDLASDRLGGQALLANDDFFAPKENLVKASTPIFIPDKYTENGKWMDGWESRRKRNVDPNSHDWCVVKLGAPGVIYGVNVDTSYFTGNFPEFCSIETCEVPEETSLELFQKDKIQWQELLVKSALQGGQANFFNISNQNRWSHLRIKIFPDGGVARLRVFGKVIPLWDKLKAVAKVQPIDLACAQNGGTVITCNDMFFGLKDNLIMPGRSKNMGDGWETKRKRGLTKDSHDWIIVKLGRPGKIRKIEVDTNHFKGNFPDSCTIDGCVSEKELTALDFDNNGIEWREILSRTKLQAHHQHFFESELKEKDKIYSYLRLKIYPDGGVSRLRVYGDPR